MGSSRWAFEASQIRLRKTEAISVYGSLEAQIVDISDQIAYQNHDIDDGIRAGIFQLKDLEKLDIWKRASANVSQYDSERLQVSGIISSLVKVMAFDLLRETERRLQNLVRQQQMIFEMRQNLWLHFLKR